ncbi:hypothetical protein [Actinokineospora bangkokensis]|uniref:Uncharacterized protein n=1 Tax=Actinokineospora bangkokensis TaxID=1193682 RepID=A0A1Q9LLA6_9PSEU|nr:hypothetical protein [Actinokineospora bangkokensis]OLR92812.1 hypothetical protein BJP25_19475 [Actinokineospora bangkokensis]
MDREDVVRELVAEGRDDWVPVLGLFHLARQVVETGGGTVADVVTDVVRALVDRGLMTIGVLGDDGHDPWPGDSSTVVARFTGEMAACGWEPDTGSLWLANTERGDVMAEGL